MSFPINFFVNLGFDFTETLQQKELFFENYSVLSAKIKDFTFVYKNPNQTNTSFYLFTTMLSLDDLSVIRKHIWNENQADLIFYILDTSDQELVLLFAKASPLLNLDNCVIDRFNPSFNDSSKIEKIKRWQFDTGALWLNYQSFLNASKFKGINTELIATLNALKGQLNTEISTIESSITKEMK